MRHVHMEKDDRIIELTLSAAAEAEHDRFEDFFRLNVVSHGESQLLARSS